MGSMMAVKEKLEDVEWSTQDEIQLLHALDGIRPVGFNKHFCMAILVERLNGQYKLSHEITSEGIWAKLRTMYNLEKLDDLEPIMIENESFSLPDHLTQAKSSEEEPEPKLETTKVETTIKTSTPREEKRNSTPLRDSEVKRTLPKRTRGSTSIETANSPSTPTPSSAKRRRI